MHELSSLLDTSEDKQQEPTIDLYLLGVAAGSATDNLYSNGKLQASI